MSAGPFETRRYKADDGAVAPIKVQPETMTLNINGQANSSVADATTTKYYARSSGGCREIGMRARKVNFKFDTAPTPYKQDAILSLPWFDPATFADIAGGLPGTYVVNGSAEDITVVSTSGECGAGNV